ncbi:MAG: hypothetical protein J2P48_23555, partial [Alphaproteobacteria bacterium]|nr:hypothetical protein [Alphaproteobacteria bacterium]
METFATKLSVISPAPISSSGDRSIITPRVAGCDCGLCESNQREVRLELRQDGWDQGGNDAQCDPSACWLCENSLENGRLIGQKRALKPKEVWAIRVQLQLEKRRRNLALFNLAIDGKLRDRDLMRVRVSDVCVEDQGSGKNGAPSGGTSGQ